MMELQAFRQRLQGGVDGPITSLDLADLRRAQVDPDRFSTGEQALLVATIRFGRALSDMDMATVIEYGVSIDGQAIARPLAVALLQNERWDAAARMMVAAAMSQPPGARRYSTWKWMETMFGNRPDYVDICRHVSISLLARFESGTSVEREVVGELFGRDGMTESDLQALRATLGQ